MDFFLDPFDFTEVGFHVFNTPENIAAGADAAMPNIVFEIAPRMTGFLDPYASVVFVAAAPSLPLQWSDYIDATDPESGVWFGTGSTFTAGCNQVTSCTWAELLDYLDDGGDGPLVYSVGVSKGTDQLWHGAVDGLRVGDTVYDFEEFARHPHARVDTSTLEWTRLSSPVAAAAGFRSCSRR